ncbi:hypothetical protein BC941DRAFT_416060 [Chlamydoabsidia padenii]|nr:hypothetical protein BC941DRAFT_416060 [Chlamydoabsidia padenii]
MILLIYTVMTPPFFYFITFSYTFLHIHPLMIHTHTYPYHSSHQQQNTQTFITHLVLQSHTSYHPIPLQKKKITYLSLLHPLPSIPFW